MLFEVIIEADSWCSLDWSEQIEWLAIDGY